jgi:hypothetical protein
VLDALSQNLTSGAFQGYSVVWDEVVHQCVQRHVLAVDKRRRRRGPGDAAGDPVGTERDVNVGGLVGGDARPCRPAGQRDAAGSGPPCPASIPSVTAVGWNRKGGVVAVA